MQVNEPESIINDVLTGDVDRYAEIIRLYQPDVWKVVAVARFDLETVRELVHRTFVEAYQHLHQYRTGTSCLNWIKKIARNLVLKEIRWRSRQSWHLHLYQHHLAARLETEQELDRYEERRIEALRRCSQNLPETYMRILRLRYEKARSIDEISGVLGRTSDAVKQMLWRARLMLRDCIEKGMARA